MGAPISQAKLAEDFMSTFNIQRKELCKTIEELTMQSPDKTNQQLTNVQNGIQNLNKILHDASLFLPAYSVKMRQNEIRELELSLKVKEKELIPKKKFGFKTKPIENADSVNTCNNPDNEIDSVQTSTKNFQTTEDSNFFTIENLENTEAVYDDDKVSKTDVLVRNLTNVIIHMHGSPSTLRISNIKNCKILCGPVHTSVFVDSAMDSVLFVCCQQLRTHSSKNTDIYLRVRSRAIIEECTGIRFAPYTWDHPLSKHLHDAAQIDDTLERYDAVDDFNGYRRLILQTGV